MEYVTCDFLETSQMVGKTNFIKMKMKIKPNIISAIASTVTS